MHGPALRTLAVYDERTGLSRALAEADRRNLLDADFIDFDNTGDDEVLAGFRALSAKDLVVQVQSTNFRLEAFRIRVARTWLRGMAWLSKKLGPKKPA